ncbi:Uncharacterised protein [Chlamydia trachomatis]|nr:Uncharacterised protein [Chlamydia trachomatis]
MASDPAIFAQHSELQNNLEEAMNSWEEAGTELDELKATNL